MRVDLAQVVGQLEDAGQLHRGDELLLAIDLLGLLDELFPLAFRVDALGCVDRLFPVRDVGHDDKVFAVIRKSTRLADWPRDRAAPVVDLVDLARLCLVAVFQNRVAHKGERVVLVGEALGVATLDYLFEVLSFSEHISLFP